MKWNKYLEPSHYNLYIGYIFWKWTYSIERIKKLNLRRVCVILMRDFQYFLKRTIVVRIRINYLVGLWFWAVKIIKLNESKIQRFFRWVPVRITCFSISLFLYSVLKFVVGSLDYYLVLFISNMYRWNLNIK